MTWPKQNSLGRMLLSGLIWLNCDCVKYGTFEFIVIAEMLVMLYRKLHTGPNETVSVVSLSHQLWRWNRIRSVKDLEHALDYRSQSGIRHEEIQ